MPQHIGRLQIAIVRRQRRVKVKKSCLIITRIENSLYCLYLLSGCFTFRHITPCQLGNLSILGKQGAKCLIAVILFEVQIIVFSSSEKQLQHIFFFKPTYDREFCTQYIFLLYRQFSHYTFYTVRNGMSHYLSKTGIIQTLPYLKLLKYGRRLGGYLRSYRPLHFLAIFIYLLDMAFQLTYTYQSLCTFQRPLIENNCVAHLLFQRIREFGIILTLFLPYCLKLI